MWLSFAVPSPAVEQGSRGRRPEKALTPTSLHTGRNPFELKRIPHVVFVEDLALDALLGTACFLVRSACLFHLNTGDRQCLVSLRPRPVAQAMGGRFRSVLPSDLRFVVGATGRVRRRLTTHFSQHTQEARCPTPFLLFTVSFNPPTGRSGEGIAPGLRIRLRDGSAAGGAAHALPALRCAPQSLPCPAHAPATSLRSWRRNLAGAAADMSSLSRPDRHSRRVPPLREADWKSYRGPPAAKQDGVWCGLLLSAATAYRTSARPLTANGPSGTTCISRSRATCVTAATPCREHGGRRRGADGDRCS